MSAQQTTTTVLDAGAFVGGSESATSGSSNASGSTDPTSDDNDPSDPASENDDNDPYCCHCQCCECDEEGYEECQYRLCSDCRRQNEETDDEDEERPRPIQADGFKAPKWNDAQEIIVYPRKLWVWVDEEVAAHGYLDLSMFQNLQAVSRRDAKNLVYRCCKTRADAHKLKQMALKYIENPGPRTVYLRCQFKGDEHNWCGTWVYNSSEEIDLLPFLVAQMHPDDKQKAMRTLQPAPTVQNARYFTFNYDEDTLFIFWGRCGESDTEQNVYKQYINSAVANIARCPQRNLIKKIEVTYCPQMMETGYGHVSNFCDIFRALPSLIQLTLTVHNHTDGCYSSAAEFYEEGDSQLANDKAELELYQYPFTIVFSDIDSEA